MMEAVFAHSCNVLLVFSSSFDFFAYSSYSSSYTQIDTYFHNRLPNMFRHFHTDLSGDRVSHHRIIRYSPIRRYTLQQPHCLQLQCCTFHCFGMGYWCRVRFHNLCRCSNCDICNRRLPLHTGHYFDMA